VQKFGLEWDLRAIEAFVFAARLPDSYLYEDDDDYRRECTHNFCRFGNLVAAMSVFLPVLDCLLVCPRSIDDDRRHVRHDRHKLTDRGFFFSILGGYSYGRDKISWQLAS
jgi:hypothetical protein